MEYCNNQMLLTKFGSDNQIHSQPSSNEIFSDYNQIKLSKLD